MFEVEKTWESLSKSWPDSSEEEGPTCASDEAAPARPRLKAFVAASGQDSPEHQSRF